MVFPVVCLPKKYIRGIFGLLKVACNCYSSVLNHQLRYFSGDAKLELYYNDIYQVPLPPQHRFPMEKYKLVREKLTLLNADTTKEGQLQFHVSPLASREELVTTHCPRVFLNINFLAIELLRINILDNVCVILWK